ncbi:MAG: hypothetical protein RL246_2103, partial [Bacteroidota bacterium]
MGQPRNVQFLVSFKSRWNRWGICNCYCNSLLVSNRDGTNGEIANGMFNDKVKQVGIEIAKILLVKLKIPQELWSFLRLKSLVNIFSGALVPAEEFDIKDRWHISAIVYANEDTI